MDTNETGFENGGRVPTCQIITPHEALDDKLDAELQSIVDRKVSQEVASAVWEAVTRFALETAQHRNPQATLAAIAFASGLYVEQGLSLTDLAEKLSGGHPAGHPQHITKQALSKRIVKFTQQVGLPPSRGMKSEAARESYRKAHTKTSKSKLP